ncbi:MucR family transcriptional regulator [Methylobacterium oryzisoli]|uniref:MucR family transcriptional regulator n=1 Tax=Methylobacterium oryzisoli TaxID=3385502 RepID=UPI003892BE64
MNIEPKFAPDGLALVVDIVSAFVSHNRLPAAELPALIRCVYDRLASLQSPRKPQQDQPVPPVPVRKTVTPNYIISLEDGKPYKTLKRHLGSRGLTPEQYRAKWGLPPDYPMVANSYAALRSDLAKANGLGQARSHSDESGSHRPKRGK